MKKLIRKFLRKLSRIVFLLTPDEFRKNYFNIEEIYVNEERISSYNHFKKYFKNAVLFKTTNQKLPKGRKYEQIRKYAIEQAILNDKKKEKLYLEFGVFKGTSINFFSNYLETIYGFDSFEGLKEDMLGTFLPKGIFNLNKKIPKLNKNVVPVVGWVQDTLDNFLNQHNQKINFVHMDVDTYETSSYVLKKIKPHLSNNAIILFDELHNYAGWQGGEYKALREVFEDNEYIFKAFSFENQAVIQIVKED
jgi:hypothetical protein